MYFGSNYQEEEEEKKRTQESAIGTESIKIKFLLFFKELNFTSVFEEF